MASCVEPDEEPGIVSGPIGARGLERLLIGNQDEQVDELDLGEAGVEEPSEAFP